ncbi:MAG: OmpA family protein, partial [Thiotrichales bacterium]
DKCPDSPAGAKVDETGCELDSDKDGVVDSQDKCPDSPAGAKVDATGCELDSDKDGIVDSQDKCPDSPAGAKVDETGCELDSDKDGVVDSQDKCPDSPAGAKVDATGCEPDADKDGVVDSADLCPNTPAGVEVDGTGCEKTASITLEGVNFKTASAELTADSSAVLERVVAALRAATTLKIEVAGHTDSQGNDELNQQLSQKRAESVRQYLINAGVDADRLVAKGYGEVEPVASNDTDDGRAKNRRVELKRLDQ